MPPPALTGTFTLGKTTLSYTLHRSRKRRRTVSLLVESESSLRITAPLRTRNAVIEGIIHKRSSWIIRRLADITARKKHNPPRAFVSGETIPFLGKTYRLQISRDVAVDTGCTLQDDVLIVNIHDAWLDEAALSQEVRFELMRWYKKEAGKVLPERTDFWSQYANLSYRRLVLSNPERRWGSCSRDNVIRLNWRLIMAPLDVIDYVVVHELCHIVHKNHSPRYWQCVGKLMPDYTTHRLTLRKQGSTYQLFN